jgi:hypothetical protein
MYLEPKLVGRRAPIDHLSAASMDILRGNCGHSGRGDWPCRDVLPLIVYGTAQENMPTTDGGRQRCLAAIKEQNADDLE